MKIYNEDVIDGESIVWYQQDNRKISFATTDPANSDYAEYLCYTAWVEAGNDPAEFWDTDLA